MPGPAGVDRQLGAVLLGGEADRGGLHAQRQVLRDHGDGEPVVGQVHGTARMRESLSPSCSPLGSTDMFEWLSSTRSDAAVADRDREVEALVLDAQLVEVAERLPGEVADLGVVAFAPRVR